MTLGIGMGISLWGSSPASSGGAAWDPSALGAGLKGWYDPSDISTLFKDTAGTIPVTADGDQVARVNDKSGNGNHLIQATSGQQPIYHTSGGKSWLLFASASSQFIATASATTITDGSGQHSAAAGVKFTNTTGTQAVLDSDGGTRVTQFLRQNAGTSQTIAFSSGGTPFTDSGPSVTAATATVLSEKTTTTTTEVFVNGTGDGSTATTGPMQSGTAQIAVGLNIVGGTNFLNGSFYGGFVYAGVIGSSDHTSAVSYYTGKM